MIIRSKRIVSSHGIVDGILEVQDGKIIDIRNYNNESVDLDYSTNIIYPGLVDTHNHGNCGYDLRNPHDSLEERKATVRHYLDNLAVFGVTGVFPTCSYDNIDCVRRVAEEGNTTSKILGIHVEGPWLNRAGEKGKAATYVVPTSEIAEQMVKDGQGWLKLVAMSPEIENIHAITDVMNENGIALSMAHTNCNFVEANQAIEKFQFQTITHLGNAMVGIHHRDVGGLGAGMLHEDIYCEFVCDFIHLAKEMVQIILKVKDNHKLMLVSDNSYLTKLPKGRYQVADGYVENDGDTKLFTDTGKIQGSNCSVFYGFQNLVKHLHVPLEEAWRFTSFNACEHYGLQYRGKLETGYYADFVVLDDEYNLQATYSEGIQIYDSTCDQLSIKSSILERKMD